MSSLLSLIFSSLTSVIKYEQVSKSYHCSQQLYETSCEREKKATSEIVDIFRRKGINPHEKRI